MQTFVEVESNDTSATAQALGNIAVPLICVQGFNTCGDGTGYNDADWFSFTIALGAFPIDFTLDWDPTADMDFVIQDSNGTAVVEVYTEAMSTQETATVTLETGDYSVFVGCWDGTETAWALSAVASIAP